MDIVQTLNNNQGVLSALAILITLIGFFITNGKITKIGQQQTLGSKSKGYQVGRDIGNIN